MDTEIRSSNARAYLSSAFSKRVGGTKWKCSAVTRCDWLLVCGLGRGPHGA